MTEQTRNVISGQARVETAVMVDRVGTLNVHQAAAHLHVPSFELPPEGPYFVDRTDEQERIAAHGAPDGGGTRPRIVTISGTGGVGKTALSVRLGHRLADAHPDGAYYLDLEEVRRDGVADPATSLTRLLLALGVEKEWLREGYGNLVRQYWGVTRGKRLLLIIDHARTGAEVEALLPASAGSLVLVVSQGPLSDLRGVGPQVALGPLSTEHTTELLRLLCGEERWATADPAAVRVLADMCAGLPKAVEVAGDLARKHPHRGLAALAERLTAELHEKGSKPVEAVWDVAYADLGPAAARLYRALPECPGPFVILPTAAALLGLGLHDTEDALAELLQAGLLDYRSGGYRQHALVRGHARRTGRAADPDGTELAAARGRLLHWLRRQAARADLLAAGPRATVHPELPPLPGVPDADLGTGKSQALHWLDANRYALHGAVALAYDSGRDEDAVALAEALWTHFLDHPWPTGAIDAFRTAVAAADRAENLRARVRTRSMLARPLWEEGCFEEAEAALTQGCALAELLDDSYDDRRMAGSAVDFRGQLALARAESALARGDRAGAAADFAAARADFTTARDIQRAIDNAYGAALQTYQLAKTAAAEGEQQAAADLFAEAHAAFAAMPGRARPTARSAYGLGRALRRLGRPAEAEAPLRAALAGAVERRSSVDEARISAELAELNEDLGRPAEAEQYRTRAAALRARHGAEPAAGPATGPAAESA